MRFSPGFFNRIRESIRVSDVVGKRVRLEKKGKDHFGLCPFHHENSPSFSVNDEKKFFHCFGCGASGDVIRFVQETNNLTVTQAAVYLAEQHGIPIPKENDNKDGIESKIYAINKIAMEWFQKNLYSTEAIKALSYLQKRSIDNETIKTFAIGYAKQNKTNLLEHLKLRGYSLNEINNAGLLSKTDKNEFIDKFRDRIIFPIFDYKGRVVAFGGRTMIPDHHPKYLNSPETDIFKKKTMLYGEHIIFKDFKKIQNVYVVEGYTDVIALYKVGITNVAATLGTAISEFHIKRLWKAVNEPDICMDGDSAGGRAMERVAHMILPMLTSGFSINFIRLPKGSDPDDIVRNSGPGYFKELAKNKISLSDALWEITLNKFDIKTPEKQALMRQELMMITEKIQDLNVRSFYKSYFNRKIRDLFGGFNNNKVKVAKNSASKESSSIAKIDNWTTIERYALNLAAIIIEMPYLLKDDSIFEAFTSIDADSDYLRKIYASLLDTFTELEIYDNNIEFKCLFDERIKNRLDGSILKYLCGDDSYFIDKVSTKSLDSMVNLWNSTFDHYSLELLKRQYQSMLNSGDGSIEVAISLRREIMEKTKYINKNHN